jgi:hypothetical protein
MSTDIKIHTITTLAEDYLLCYEMSEADAAKNAAHLFEHVLVIDAEGNIRNHERLMPFFWLKHTITDSSLFDSYQTYLQEHDGEAPDWAETKGIGCDIELLPFLDKGADSETVIHVPILLQPTEFKDQSGQTAIAQTNINEWQDRSNTIT